jgi:hypothetical protein
MRRLFVPTFGPSDWRRLLANPETQWRASKSAYECAVAWEAARMTPRGLPPDLISLFDSTDEFRGASLLLGVPEHQVQLPGGGHASQTDFWALIDAPIGVCSLALEAKAGEHFDDLVGDWLPTPTEDATNLTKRPSGKPLRLKHLCEVMELRERDAIACRYQLLHRPVAAIREAKRFRLRTALFLVHAFGDNSESWKDYERWAGFLSVTVAENSIHRLGTRDGIDLWLGWLNSSSAGDPTVRAAV